MVSFCDYNSAMERRDFLRVLPLIPAALWGIGCEQSHDGIRRKEGVWTDHEIEALAKSMMAETPYNDVAYAGQLLLNNLQGKPSFSLESDILSDSKLALVTDAKYDNPMAAVLTGDGQIIPFAIVPKNGGPKKNSSSPEKVRIDQILISGKIMGDKSDFMFKIVVAKEIYNAKATDMAVDLAEKAIYQEYDPPPTPKERRLLRTNLLLTSTVNGVPVKEVVDQWAHLLMVPNYLIAKEKGRFTPADYEGNWLEFFEVGSQKLLANGGLARQGESYSWTDRAYKQWLDIALKPHT